MGQVDVMVLLHNLTQLLAQERNKLPDGMEDQARWYYNCFQLMLGFLTYAGRMYDRGMGLSRKIAELAYRTEDIVDTQYRRYKMADQDQDQDEQPFFLKMDHTGKLKKDIVGMIERIEGLMSGGNSGSSGRFQYDSRRKEAIQALNHSLPRTTRGWVVDPEVDFVVDNRKGCDLLVDRLINGGPPEDIDFIGIVGGMDMIDLVKKVYHDASVRQHFDSRAWVFFPGQPDTRNLLLSILKDIMAFTPEDIHKMEVWELKRILSEQLIGIRYLIVLESVIYFRELMINVFPKDMKGSRVILATTSLSSAMSFIRSRRLNIKIPYDGDPPYSKSRVCDLFTVKYLDKEVCWKVFCKKIFGEKDCPEELKYHGRRIVNGSSPSPSLVVQTASILRVGEKTISRWSSIAEVVDALYDGWPIGALSKCYDEMPQHLKTCFLYLTIFPEGTEISVKQLIRLWIAEGLIQWLEEESANSTANKQARRMEDVAEIDCLEGLIGLNFIQVTNKRSDGGPKTCRLHPSYWNKYKEISSQESFVHFYPEYDFWKKFRKIDPWKGLPRRLSIEEGCAKYDASSWLECFIDGMIKGIDDKQWLSSIDDLDSNKKSDIIESKLEERLRSLFCRLRTLSCFDQDAQKISEETWESIFKYTRLLRVLNLEEVEVGKLPKAMEKLFHLKYLSVKPAKNTIVPKSIFNLRNLQTIDLRTTRFPELPKGIWKMQQLRHLFLSGDEPSSLLKPESEDCTLPNLQTLSFISIDPDDGIYLSKRIPNLRKLGLCGYGCFDIDEQQMTFNLPHLQTLKFAGECNFEVPIAFPDTITKISTVKGVCLQQNVIEMFGKLSNLQVLKLVETSFDDGELAFGEGSFPQLQLLKFEASNIVSWRLEDNTMPKLHRLIIGNCPQLIELPPELWKVNTLQELDLSRASMKFAKKVDDHLRGKEGLKFRITFPLSSRSGT